MMTPTLLNHRYKVIQVLASEGFGETFLAEDTQTSSKRKCLINLHFALFATPPWN
ncbi:MAG: hypothetical protein WBA07_03135 [Rivularia sp. (in: cyanobacteria)]